MESSIPKTIGIVDVETSHPQSWIPILKQMGYVVKDLYDSGLRYSRDGLQAFAQHHGVSNIYTELDALAENVDIALILSVNWDVHLQHLQPFLEKNKPVLIDKPLIGTVRDARQLLRWEQVGHLITGGSSLRFSAQLRNLRDRLNSENKQIHSIYTCCSGHPFYQGSHLISLLQGLLGKGITQVRCLQAEPWKMELEWIGGQRAIVEVFSEEVGYIPFSAVVITDQGIECLTLSDAESLYADFLSDVIPTLASGKQPVPLAELLEVEFAYIAGLRSVRVQVLGLGWVNWHLTLHLLMVWLLRRSILQDLTEGVRPKHKACFDQVNKDVL